MGASPWLWPAVLLTGALEAQEFVSVPDALPPACAMVDAGGARFAVSPVPASASGAVVMARDGSSRALPSTAATGAVHELAALPWGTVVVACDGGLFVTDAEHPVLDPADLRDGAPSGAVRSVAADPRGRLWWCSAEQLGVLDLQARFGRVFTAADGLPPAPFARLAVGADGRVLLGTAGGTFAYRPDDGPPPVPRGPTLPAAPLRAGADGTVVMAADVAARGEPMLRVRRKHHHLLVLLGADGVVRGLRPGRHVLELHAVDRDLRRTVLGEYTVDVPVPKAFDPRVLLGAAALGGLLLWVAAWRARAGERPLRRLAWATARTAVLGVVALQLLAAVLGYGRSWPFVGFTMYTETWHEGDVLHRPRITGVRADGTRVGLHEHEVGVHQDGYWQMLAEVAFGGDAAARAFFAKVAACAGPGEQPFTGFTLADGRIRLTPEGPVDVAPTVLVAWSER